MRRIPTWFVMVWVVVVSITAVGGGALAYTFVRDRAAELHEVLELPDPPQLGRPSQDNPSGPVATATQAAADVTPVATSTPGTTAQLVAPPETPPTADPNATPDAAEVGTAGADSTPDAAAFVPAPLQNPRRVNVLLLGIDQRAGETGPSPTDTIMLLSLDPVGKTGALLSIPRDLWVEMPGLGISERINAANIQGEAINYPGGGGPAYAAAAVEKLLGIGKIDYYVLINFEVFYTVIDAIGPIQVCPPEEIRDDAYPDGSYGTISIYFPAGCQELDSEKLLQYARTRHADSDIGRSARQQEVILAVRQKVLSTGGIMALLPQATAIWQSMHANIRTNMSFEDMVSLALAAEKVPSENIRQAQISFEEVFIGKDANGSDILVPISSDIQLLLSDLFRAPGTPSRSEQASGS